MGWAVVGRAAATSLKRSTQFAFGCFVITPSPLTHRNFSPCATYPPLPTYLRTYLPTYLPSCHCRLDEQNFGIDQIRERHHTAAGDLMLAERMHVGAPNVTADGHGLHDPGKR